MNAKQTPLAPVPDPEEILGYGSKAITEPLDDHTLAEIARSHAETGAEIESLTEERKKTNTRLRELRGHRAVLDKQVQSGQRERAVRVRYVEGPGANVLEINDETGELLETRAMTVDEQQGRFPWATTERGADALALVGRIKSGDRALGSDVPLLTQAKDLVHKTPDTERRQAIGDETDPDVLKVALAWEESTKARERTVLAFKERLHELGEGPSPTETEGA